MKTLSYKIIFVASALWLALIGCKSTKPLESNAKNTVPEFFMGRRDSLNSASINWKQYFSDAILISLIDSALKNNLDLLVALQKIEAANWNVRMAKGALLPSINAHTSAAQRKYGLYTMDGAGNISTEITKGRIVPIHLPDYYVGLQTSWEVDLWGKLRNRKRAAVARYLATVEGKNLVITNLIADLANSYYELLALDNELDIIRETIKLQEDALSIVQVQKEAGVANELAITQFQGQLFNSKVLEKEILQRILESENKINFLMGRYPQPITRNKLDFNKPLPFQVHVGIPSDLLRNRPDIRQAEYNLIATKADLRASQLALYPSLNINGAYGFQAFKTGLLLLKPESVAYTIFGGLTAPLINRSALRTQFRTASTLQRESIYSYQQSIINGYVEVYNEMARIRSLEDIHELRKSGVDVLTNSVTISSDLYRTGRANYLEVLLTQRNSLDARIQLIDAKRRQYFAVVNIYKALGGGWQ